MLLPLSVFEELSFGLELDEAFELDETFELELAALDEFSELELEALDEISELELEVLEDSCFDSALTSFLEAVSTTEEVWLTVEAVSSLPQPTSVERHTANIKNIDRKRFKIISSLLLKRLKSQVENYFCQPVHYITLLFKLQQQ